MARPTIWKISRNTARNQLHPWPFMMPVISKYVNSPTMPFQNRQMTTAAISLPSGDLFGLSTIDPDPLVSAAPPRNPDAAGAVRPAAGTSDSFSRM
jgi:hypothetical protein